MVFLEHCAYLGSLALLTVTAQATSFEDKCNTFANQLHLENTTVWFSEHVPAGTNLTFPDNNVTCARPAQVVSKEICRVAMYVATSNRSGISMEAWLPDIDAYTGRFLSTGNGGVSGCMYMTNSR